jgi:hypothetical protein
MLANIELCFDEVTIQSEELENEYSIPQQQTQIKDIQLRTQRVSRLIQVNIFSLSLLIITGRFVFRKLRNISIKFIRKNKNVIIFSNN